MPKKTAAQAREKSSAHIHRQRPAVRASRQHSELVNPVTAFARVQGLPASQMNPANILTLQRAVGNRVVEQILSAQASERSSSASGARPVVQAKLTVGPANDHYEQEADHIARKVTGEQASESGAESIQRQVDEDEPLQRAPLASSITPLVQRQQEPLDDEEIQTSSITPRVQRQQETDDDEEIQTSSITPRVQRQQETDDGEEIQTKRSGRDGSFVASAELERRLQSRGGGGSSLPGSLRLPMEHRFGASFENVRIHTGGEAAQLNRSLNAKAFTHGNNIYFGEGAYNPASEAGRQLLAHELTHVVQQGATKVDKTGVRRKAAVTQSSEKIVQRVVLSPTLSYFSPSTRERLRRLDEERRRRSMTPAPEQGPGRAARVRQWVAEKKQGAYDPVQARHKPALVTAGISGTSAVTGAVSGLVSMLPSVSQVAAASGGGSAAGALAAISGPVNVVSGLYNTFKGDSKQQKAEGGLSAVAGLGQTFAGSALAVDSISKLADVASTGTRFLSAAVLPAQIAMSAIDVVRGTYGAAKAIARAKALQRIKNEFRNTRLAHFAEFASQYQGKRKRTAALNTAAGVASLIGGALLLSGVAAPAGIAFLALGGVLKVGSLFGGWLRDKLSSQKAKAKKDEEDRWALYVDRALSPENVNTEHGRGVLRILSVMGMQRDTINRVIREDDPNKRLAVIRTLIMRR